jgi:hypothetical protein
MRQFAICALVFFSTVAWVSADQDGFTQLCQTSGIQPYYAGFEPSGIILASFDSADLWVFDIARNRRYPLPDTQPCGTGCHLSPDAQRLTYYDPVSGNTMQMRLNGTERSMVSDNASEVEWWSNEALLVWTQGHQVYIQPLDEGERQYLSVQGLISVQPTGYWGLVVEPDGNDGFQRVLLNLETNGIYGVAEERVTLGADQRYFNAYGWSPDGTWLAFVAPGAYDQNLDTTGGEIFAIRPGDAAPVQWTDFTAVYGAVRIDGHAIGQLSWSPDSTRIAFWVTEMLSSDPTSRMGNAVIHMLDTTTGDVTVFCGFSTDEHTPDPPRLIWSPDGTYLAFGGNVPGDDKGYLLLALDTATGTLTELSNGLFPALGAPDPVAWGFVGD